MKTKLLILSMLLINSWTFSQGWIDVSITTNYFNENGAIYPINKDTVFVVLDNGYIFRTYNGGDNWDQFSVNIDTIFYDLAFYDVDTGYATGANGTIVKTIDKGESWTLLNTETNNNINSIFINSADNIWAVADSGIIINSFDYGNTWNIIDTITQENLNSIKFRNPSTCYIAGNNGTLLYTQNAGNTWDTLDTGGNLKLKSISLTDNYIYLLETEYYDSWSDSILFSNDNINWTRYQSRPIQKISFISDSIGFGAYGDMFTKCSGGVLVVHKTNNFGEFFEQSLDMGIPDNVGFTCDVRFINDSVGYAMTNHYIVKTLDGGSLTIISDVNNFNSKSSIKIYPNPATTSFIIELKNTNADLSLEILDITGRIILQKDNIQNEENINISRFIKGIYFVKIKNGEEIIENKKLIIK